MSALRGNFSFPDVCWKYNTANREHSQRFLDCVEDSFLVREPTREGVLVDLLFVNRAGLVGDTVVGGCLGYSDYRMVEFSVAGEVKRGISRPATWDFHWTLACFRHWLTGSLGRQC